MYDPSQRGGTSPESFSNDLRAFEEQTSLEDSTMLNMAEQTGGHAFINTNGLKEALDTAVTTGANFYTITYTPSDTNWTEPFAKSNSASAPAPPRRNSPSPIAAATSPSTPTLPPTSHVPLSTPTLPHPPLPPTASPQPTPCASR